MTEAILHATKGNPVPENHFAGYFTGHKNKKLRYAVEFLASLYGKDAGKFTAALEHIQDGLGRMNDAAIGRHLIARLSLHADAEILFAGSRAEQIDDLHKHFKTLRKVGRFWA